MIAPAGTAPSAAHSTVSGAEIDLSGGGVTIASTILLPSGKLVVNAIDDIALAGGSRIDLAGQPSMIQKATVYGFGGTAIFQQHAGERDPGRRRDRSSPPPPTPMRARSASPPRSTCRAALMARSMRAATAGFTSGDFGVTRRHARFCRAQRHPESGRLLRRPQLRPQDRRSRHRRRGQGAQRHGLCRQWQPDGCRHHRCIRCGPGTIRLSADNGLTLASGAVLDVHGNVLQVDSYGQPIEAKNRGHIELTAAGGEAHAYRRARS